MSNCTMNSYEMKRDILNFSKKLSEGVNKSTSKFVMDMQYGLAKGGSVLISNIARSLDENIKLNYTIDRLCDNLVNLYQEEKEMIWNNYLNEVSKNIEIKEKEDVIKIVRLYLSRWRIEEHFRGKKQEYDFENMRVRNT